MNVDSSIIHNNQRTETNKMSMNKENVVYP